MKTLLRYFLINFVALWSTSEIIKGLSYTGGIQTLLLGALVFSLINLLLVPLLKILLLPLNLLTLGFFAWTTNVVALYILTAFVPQFIIRSYFFPGFEYNGLIIPAYELSSIWVAIIASFLISLFTHFMHWLMR